MVPTLLAFFWSYELQTCRTIFLFVPIANVRSKNFSNCPVKSRLSPHPQNIKMPVWRRIQHTFSTLPMFLFLFFFSVICLNINIFVRNKAKLKYTTGFQIRVIKIRDISFFSLLLRVRLPRPEQFSGQSRLSGGMGQTSLFGIQDCPAGL